MSITDSVLDIYKMLTPKDLVSKAPSADPTNMQEIEDYIQSLLLDDKGKMRSFESIKSAISTYYAGINDASKKKEVKYSFHGISNKGIVDFGDSTYWNYNSLVMPVAAGNKMGTRAQKVSDLGGILKLDTFDANKTVSVFVTSSPRVTPATCSTAAVELFLNYMPSIMASRMVPYLCIEFEMHHPVGLTQANSSALNTPNIIRFLLGSSDGKGSDTKDMPITEADKAMLQVVSSDKKSSMIMSDVEKGRDTLFMGPEMFLLPQTLTNMDYLNGGGGGAYARLVKPKPFLPFASIEDFLVQYVNAGAGAMIHKKGTLKMKIHDKSRLSEFSQFIKGPTGFRDVTIWTTMGWLAPRTIDGEEDAYAKFINENMIKRDCWMIANTQFSFDAVGQVVLSLEMVSKGMPSLQQSTIGGGGYEDLRKKLEELGETVTGLLANLPGSDAETQADLKTSQLLGAARRGSMLEVPPSEFKGYDALITQAVASLKKSGKLSQEEITKVTASLLEIKTASVEYSKAIQNNFNSKLQINSTLADPFLVSPDRAVPPDMSYFNIVLSESYQGFYDKASGGIQVLRGDMKANNADPYSAAQRQEAASLGVLLDVEPQARVISFGKLFMMFVAPEILKTCSELQVIFYGLNEQCGPVSGHSIAEFPIDTLKLMHGYMAMVKALNGPVSIEAFMGLVIENQFNDNRSPGYGMYSAFEPFKLKGKDEVKKKEKKEYESAMADWTSKYGSLKRPIIEMVVEVGGIDDDTTKSIHEKLKTSQRERYMSTNAAPTAAGGSIKRVHIYDKQHSPYNLLTKLMSTPTGWTVGEIDSDAIDTFLKEKFPSTPPKGAKKTTATAEQMLTALQQAGAQVQRYEYPYGKKYDINKDRKSVVNFVKSQAPNINIGVNGTLVKNAALASKTDGLLAAANIINSSKPAGQGGVTDAVESGLEDPNSLPMRVVPAQLTLTTLGCPIAQMYQQYFVDLGTGTTIDNLYTTVQVSHTIAPGKFETSWTMAFTDGYGKFKASPDIAAVMKGEVTQRLEELGRT